MRRTAFQMTVLALSAVLAAMGCANDEKVPGSGGVGGSGAIDILPPGTGGSGGSGGQVGQGGSGGVEPGVDFELDGVHPGYGSTDGGTRVTISGSGFIASVPDEALGASTVVLFGDNPSIDARVVDDHTISATSPVGLVGEVDVVVRNSSGEQRCEGCFSYLPPLRLDSITPSVGHVRGGDRITLRGHGLGMDTVVLFGSRAGLDQELNEDGSLSLTLPPGDAAGLVDVRIFSASRQSLLRRAFRYRSDLFVEGIEPPVSPLAGGETVLISGEGFSASTRVYFGDNEALVRQGEAGLEATVPAATQPGAVRVEVTDGLSSSTYPFAYVDPSDSGFALYALSPEQGPTHGGYPVTLLGSGLDAEGLIAFFGEKAAGAELLGDNMARVMIPSAPAGLVDVRARNLEGMDTLEGAYRYLANSRIDSISPAKGPMEGGTPFTLRGNFPERLEVFVGAREATDVLRISDTEISAVTPPGSDGPVPVRVVDTENPGHEAVMQNAFRYEGPLSLAVVDPALGARAGGSRVYVRGTGFRGEMTAFLGANEAESVTVIDPFTLEVITPRGNVGLVDLRVEREDGASATLEGAFSYFNPSSGYGGSSGGPLNGVLNVTVIALTGPDENGPIEGCMVYVGADESALLTKQTDDRGQATFSSSSLVKAVSLTVHCENYEIATVSNQVSENVTVLLAFNGPADGEPDDPPPQPPPSMLAGRVHGFKLPPSRVLQPHEREVALVNLAYGGIYNAPPFGEPLLPQQQIEMEGGMFTWQFVGVLHATVYAVYGIHDTQTNAFEPLLMGYKRGVSVPLSGQVLDVEIVLDTRLDQEVPVTIQNPAWDARNGTQVTAFLDLGSDGVIPLGVGLNTDHPEEALLTNLPDISGESVIFQAMGFTQVQGQEGRFYPITLSFRRQGGDLSQGVTIGPLLGVSNFTEPLPIIPGLPLFFDGTFEWTIEPSPEEPDVVYIRVFQPPSLMNPEPIPEWHVVLPGDTRRVTMPNDVRDALRAKFGGQATLTVEIITGSQPSFDFPEWNYANIGLGNFTNFTINRTGIIP